MGDYTNIWVDTGGTFTDCIVQKLDDLEFYKVLSDGSLRGQITKKIGKKLFLVQQNWSIKRDILAGYHLEIGGPNLKTKIKQFDPAQNTIEIEDDLEIPIPAYVKITAYEEAPVLAMRIALQKGLYDSLENINLKLGTTKGTNALLEHKGGRVLQCCTIGFKDLSLIGTQQRPNIFQLAIPHPTPLFTNTIEIKETISAEGNIIQPMDVKGIQKVDFSKYDAVAITFKNSYKNDVHERDLKTYIESITSLPLSVSSELSRDSKLLNRTQATLINAYLDPVLNEYFSGIQSKMIDSRLIVMTSTGNLLPQDLFKSMDSLLSGPAGGLKGAVSIGQSLGFDQLITFDMGGTSTDVSRFNEGFDYLYRTEIGGFETSIPSLNIETVAAGGGSICFFEDGQLKVGPESAGANPGPASYGLGGPLTVTDVNILLGKIYTNAFQFPVDFQSAEFALQNLCEASGLTGTEALKGLEVIANQKMANTIQKISVSKGFHPKDYTMISFGGAGGLHACEIAEQLNIQKIVFPYASGVLSAYGIGKSRLEKLISESLLLELNGNRSSLKSEFERLSNSAKSFFKSTSKLNLDQKWMTIGIKGQESNIDIHWFPNIDIRSAYMDSYQKLYGFIPEETVLEIRQIHLLAKELGGQEFEDQCGINKKMAEPYDNIYSRKYGKEIQVYNWDKLSSGDSFKGPCILYNGFGSVFLEKNWNLTITDHRQAIAYFEGETTMENLESEVINLAVYTNRFQHIAEEMGTQLQKTAYSVNIKERLDFSCGILDPYGRLIANAPHIPVHLGSLGMCGRMVLEEISINVGDIIITNHPKFGGSHLPDITLIKGVFNSEGRLICYLINRAHHAEIGGTRPGSMPPGATSLEEEGVIFPPMYLSKNGEFLWNKIEQHLKTATYPSRAVKENMADLKAAVASLIMGEKAILELEEQMGVENLVYYMNRIIENASNIISNSMDDFYSDSFEAVEEMDDGRKIKIKISKTVVDKWIFDFEGTGPVHPGNLNANISIVHSAVLYVLRLIAGRDIPLNEGLMENIEIKLPVSFINPDFSENPKLCPAVVGGNTEVSQRLVDTLLKAFGLAACSQGTMNNFLFGNEHFGYYETIGGGSGATINTDGRSAVHQHMTNTRITDPEDLERNYPVRLHEFSIRKNSGGNGHLKGGNGIIREIEFLEKVDFTLISQHRKVSPYGLNGGKPGKVGNQSIIRKNGDVEILDGVDQATLNPGDKIRIETPGGGGYGKQY